MRGVTPKASKRYDVAIAYAQGMPTFYVAEKIDATSKYAWVNVSYRLEEIDRTYQEQFYDIFDSIIAVSETTKQIFLQTFKKYEEKIQVIFDINDAKLIEKMAYSGTSYKDDFTGTRILTIGRLAPQKGYDIALEACRRLKEQKVDFRW